MIKWKYLIPENNLINGGELALSTISTFYVIYSSKFQLV